VDPSLRAALDRAVCVEDSRWPWKLVLNSNVAPTDLHDIGGAPPGAAHSPALLIVLSRSSNSLVQPFPKAARRPLVSNVLKKAIDVPNASSFGPCEGGDHVRGGKKIA